MSRWIRGIYNAAANFNLSNALRATRVGILGGSTEHLREGSNQRNKHVQSGQSCQSNQSSEYGGTCHRNRDTTCSNGDHCYVNKCGHVNTVIIGNDVIITDSSELCDNQCNKCHPTFCDHIERDYAEYTTTINTQGQGTSSRLWFSNESGDSQHSDNAARTNVEYTTGIPTGTAI